MKNNVNLIIALNYSFFSLFLLYIIFYYISFFYYITFFYFFYLDYRLDFSYRNLDWFIIIHSCKYFCSETLIRLDKHFYH